MRTKTLKAILIIISAVLFVSWVVSVRQPKHNTYPVLLQVVAVQGLGNDDASDAEEGYLVCLKNCHGFTYRIKTDCGDFDLGDYYVCVMDDMGTAKIMDDQIIDYKYERPDLFTDMEDK